MKTEIAILWVEDEDLFFKANEMQLEDWLDNLGFDLKVYFHKKAEGVLDDISKDNIELIILDYNLPGPNGDELINELRRNDFYHDIVFYSAGRLPNIRFDGVFYVSKDDTLQRVKELILLKLKRLSDVATLRGWIVADAIELEGLLDEILLKCFSPKNKLFEEKILRRSFTLDFKKKKDIVNSILNDEITRLRQEGDTSDRFNKLVECQEVIRVFEPEVIHYRNAVAHGKVEELPDGTKQVKNLANSSPPYYKLDEASLIDGRKKFRKQFKCLSDLSQLLCI